ncbi:MAG: alpha-1,2-fucosyltransferase [Pseudomonadota bacterium]
MIIFIEYGRLGNQLFQYAALKSLAKDEKLYFIGFDDFKSTFDGHEAKFLIQRGTFIYRLLVFFLPQLNTFLWKIPIFRVIKQKLVENEMSVEVKSGFINSVSYCCTSSFQSEKIFSPNVITHLKIKSDLLNKVKDQIHNLNCANQKLIFVHIRRGDYIRWPSKETPGVIPGEWYRRCISEMQKRYQNPFFIFASDDIHYVKDLFSDLQNSFISEANKGEDFALMTLCDGGILSASSFAWWAAYFAKKQNSQATFLAPLYWAGHSTSQWYPPSTQSSFLEYVPVIPK